VAVFQGDGRGMQLGDALNDGKPETRASSLPAIAPPEALKDKFALVFSYTWSVVENAHDSLRFDHEFHGRSRSGVVDGIFRKVSDGTAQHLRIALDPNRIYRAEQGDVLALRQRQRRDKLRDLGGHGSKIGLFRGIHHERIQFRNVEQLTDDMRHAFDVLQQGMSYFLVRQKIEAPRSESCLRKR